MKPNFNVKTEEEDKTEKDMTIFLFSNVTQLVGTNVLTGGFVLKLNFLSSEKACNFLSAPSSAGGRKNTTIILTQVYPALEMHYVFLNLHTLQEGLDSPSHETGQ